MEVKSPMALLETEQGRGSVTGPGGRLSFDGEALTADEVGLRVSDSFYKHVGHSTAGVSGACASGGGVEPNATFLFDLAS